MTVAIVERVAPADRVEDALYLLSAHLTETPTEGGNGNRDSWRDRVDELLAQLRADLVAIGDEL